MEATDWYYQFSCDTDYIRRYRIKKDMRWKYKSAYGPMDITINLSKPEKDPKAIAAAKNAPQTAYPKCQLCRENEGYAGRMNHPARANHRIVPIEICGEPWCLQYSPYVYYNEHCIVFNSQHVPMGRMNHPARANHRIVPIEICGEPWCLQYSPYVYYNEHCIVFNSQHVPMKIDKSAFQKLLDFVRVFPHYFVGSNADLPIVGGSILSHEHFQGGHYCFAMEQAAMKLLDFVRVFPHYFVGSNADLPIVGGSILSHEHFQGGHYCFAMEQAAIRETVRFAGFEDIQAGIVNWPMSVIRLDGEDPARLADLADKILTAWRGYSDEQVGVLAFTDGEPHNTITPIARRRGELYELDLVLRCNITTAEHPLGVFHPHADKHHIKKENIGLIEVMGLAVLPSRLKQELADLAQAIVAGDDIAADPVLGKHAQWVQELKQQYTFNQDNALEILLQETGKVFAAVLEDAGVYKNDAQGQTAWVQELKQQYTFNQDNALEILLQETGKVFAAVLEDAGVYKNDAQGQTAFARFIETVNQN